MHPDMLSQMVKMEHVRRVRDAERAAALNEVDQDGDRRYHTRRSGRLAWLLAMRPHRHQVPAGTSAAHVS